MNRGEFGSAEPLFARLGRPSIVTRERYARPDVKTVLFELVNEVER
jgi:hypothetical protein